MMLVSSLRKEPWLSFKLSRKIKKAKRCIWIVQANKKWEKSRNNKKWWILMVISCKMQILIKMIAMILMTLMKWKNKELQRARKRRKSTQNIAFKPGKNNSKRSSKNPSLRDFDYCLNGLRETIFDIYFCV